MTTYGEHWVTLWTLLPMLAMQASYANANL